MPSTSYRRWTTARTSALNEIAQAHAAVGGTGRGRRYATQQINQAYAVLLASQFQGYCHDLHSECVDHVVATIAPPVALQLLVRAEFTRGRHLDRGNAQPASLGADFGRLGIDFWAEVVNYNVRNRERRKSAPGSVRTSFTATSLAYWSSVRVARKTSPMPPDPISSTI